jgi:putative colanic acid biosynthesis acetyltransferase WcaF
MTYNKLRPQTVTISSKIARVLWHIVWLFLYRPSPAIAHGWRCLLLRSFGAHIGKGAHPYPDVKIWAPWNLTMSDHSTLANGVDCYCVDRVILGRHVTVSQYSYLCTASHDYRDRDMPLITAPIVIGDHAWITADVFIGPGVTIGDGTVITARSSVFSDIGPWRIAKGNPALAVGDRNSDDII